MRTRPSFAVPSLIASLAAIFAGGCQSNHSSKAAHGPAHAPAHWGYTGEVNPANWSELSADYSLCASGACQSPINVVSAEPTEVDNPVFAYRPSAINVVNNGHTIQVNCDAGSTMTLEGKTYQLAQFHFHAPSEHRINGQAFAAEMHLVHKADDGALAVIGLFITPGHENVALAPIFSQLPTTPGPVRVARGTINAADVLPPVRTSFRYGGSLTTPPCSESVSWTLLTTPIEMSAAQLKAFTDLYTGNNRPVQPVNARVVVEDVSQ